MKTQISKLRIQRIREQGYFTQSDQEVSNLSIGNRFAYQLCTTILTIGIIISSKIVLSIMMLVAFLSVILPNHVFDYLYNYVLSNRLNLPKLPRRSPQLKFACSVATIWLGITIYLIHNTYILESYLFGGVLVVIAILVSTMDLCIPSIIYNKLFKNKSL